MNDQKSEMNREITWLSEAGKMEFFIFGASLKNGGPKQIYKHLAEITGFSPLPPYFSLGFHYSKWEDIDTERMTYLLSQFNEHELPVDVFWLDIGYTDQNKYFELEYSKFRDIKKYVKKIQDQDKRLTIITDPHIKVDPMFFVYTEG